MSVLFPLFHNTLFGRKPLCKTHPNRVGSHALLPARQRIYINYLEFFYIRDMSILFHFKCIQSFIYINKDSQGNLFYILDYNVYAWALSPVCLFAAPWTVWTVAHQAPPSMEFSRQEYWNGLLFLWQVSSLPAEPPGKPQYSYFLTQIALALAIGGFFNWMLYLFDIYPRDFGFIFPSLEHFSLYGTTWWSRLIFWVNCLSPRISHFSKETWFFFWRVALDTKI